MALPCDLKQCHASHKRAEDSVFLCVVLHIGILPANNGAFYLGVSVSAKHFFSHKANCIGDGDRFQGCAVIKSMAVNVDRSGGDDHRFQRSAVIKRIFSDDLQPCRQL